MSKTREHSANIFSAISQTDGIGVTVGVGDGSKVGVGGTSVGIAVGSSVGVGEGTAVGGTSVGITAVDSAVTGGTVPLHPASANARTRANISLAFIEISPCRLRRL